jgi:hypothetical protein
MSVAHLYLAFSNFRMFYAGVIAVAFAYGGLWAMFVNFLIFLSQLISNQYPPT